jgi:zinc and cadmium transporter
MLLAWIMAFSLLGSLGSTAGAAAVLLFPEAVRRRIVPCVLSYATGTLLAAAFLGMIPAALRDADASTVTAAVLGGIVSFFVLEKLVIWRHCHVDDCEVHGRAAPLILIGDAFHNAIDGIVIAAAFHTSVPLGVAAAVAVIGHEIPQEVGDFAILLDAGYSRRKAFLLNSLSAGATLPAAVAGYFWLSQAAGAVPYLLAVAAASFIYIATADLIPSLHHQTAPVASLRQLALLLVGIATIALLRAVAA